MEFRRLPRHLGIIPDGNRRWADIRGLPKDQGYAAGVEPGIRMLGVSRFDLKYSAGTLRHERLMRSIELYGREVIPRVRGLLAGAMQAAGGGGVAASSE
jgi:hypothetical protein